MAEPKRITHQFLEVVKLSESPLDRLLIPVLLGIGILYMGAQGLQGHWLDVGFFAPGVLLLLALATSKRLQKGVLGQAFNRRHAIYIGLYWVHSTLWLGLLRLVISAPSAGKESDYYYTLAIMVIALSWMTIRSLLMLTRLGYHLFISQIPIWEQLLVAANELVAAGLLAYVGGNMLAHALQPAIFTTRTNTTYATWLAVVVVIYYVGMQMMWVQRWNDWLGKNSVWVALARLLAPLALAVVSMMIYARLARRADPRTANLLGSADLDLGVLALAPVIWLVIGVILVLVYTSRKGLRQRFLPDLLLDRLPPRVSQALRTVSDMDMLLVIGLLATFIPLDLFLLSDSGGLISLLRQQIFQRGSALIETSEQALALVFTLPFYALIVALLVLYAYTLSRAALSADERDELVGGLPIGFLIILIITLYLFALPFSQVLTEGRLPLLPQDLGRILAYYILIPLLLLYFHYFFLVRWPYRRGQSRWREQQSARLSKQLAEMERRLDNLNRELQTIDSGWRDVRAAPGEASTNLRLETLYRYVQLNGMRDDLNMQRLQALDARQQLTEISEAPVSIAVARLPLRVVSLGIPLLLLIQIYQWAVVNNGLRQVINNPNITVVDFFRTILKQAQF